MLLQILLQKNIKNCTMLVVRGSLTGYGANHWRENDASRMQCDTGATEVL